MDVMKFRAPSAREASCASTMTERTEACSASFQMARGGQRRVRPQLDWLVAPRGDRAPHVPVIDKSQREDGVLAQDFSDEIRDIYTCPAGKSSPRLAISTPITRQVSARLCRACPLKAKCCPNSARATDRPRCERSYRDIACASKLRRSRNRGRDRNSHVVGASKRILRFGPIMPSRSPSGAQFDVTLAAIAQNRRHWWLDPRPSHPRALREHGVRFVASELPMHQRSPCGAIGAKRWPQKSSAQPTRPSSPTSTTKSTQSRHAC